MAEVYLDLSWPTPPQHRRQPVGVRQDQEHWLRGPHQAPLDQTAFAAGWATTRGCAQIPEKRPSKTTPMIRSQSHGSTVFTISLFLYLFYYDYLSPLNQVAPGSFQVAPGSPSTPDAVQKEYFRKIIPHWKSAYEISRFLKNSRANHQCCLFLFYSQKKTTSMFSVANF